MVSTIFDFQSRGESLLKVLSLQAYALFLAKVCPNRECQPGRPCIRRPDRRQSQGALVQAGGEASFSGTVVSLHNKVSIGRADFFLFFAGFKSAVARDSRSGVSGRAWTCCRCSEVQAVACPGQHQASLCPAEVGCGRSQMDQELLVSAAVAARCLHLM